MTAICANDVGCQTPAVSDAARALLRTFKQVQKHFLDTWSGHVYWVTVRRTFDAYDESSDPDWDGRGVALMTLSHALRFLDHVPAGYPAADVSVDPDGEISFEWYREPRRTFAVSVGPDGRLSYAGLFGDSRIRGSEAYFMDELPPEVHSSLRRVFS